MGKFILIKACEGIIGPKASCPPHSLSYHSYDEAFEAMVEDIEDEGGGDYSEDYGYGTSDNGYAYEIFSA